jgi:predicted Zn finger-like uncharacterized protein
MTSLTCPHCHATLRSAQSIPAGKTIRCPKCAERFVAPQEDSGDSYSVAGIAARGADQVPSPNVEAEPSSDDDEIPRVVRRGKRRPESVEDEDAEGDTAEDSEDEDEEARRPRPTRRRTSRQRIPLWIPLVGGVVLLLLIAGGSIGGIWFFLNWDKNRGTGHEDPLLYVAADSAAMIGIDFGTLLNDSCVGPPIRDALLKNSQSDFEERCKKETGLEFKQLFDHVVLVAKSGSGASNLQSMIAVSAVPFDQHQIRRSAKDAVACRFKGKTYFKVKENQFDLMFMPSDRIVMLTNMSEPMLQGLIAADGSTAALGGDVLDLAHTLQSNHLWVAAPLNDAAKQQFQQGFGQAGPMAAGLQPLSEAVAKARAFGAWASLEGDRVNLSLGLRCSDESQAKKASETLQTVWDKQIKGMAMFAQAGVPPAARPLFKEFMDTAHCSAQGAVAHISARVAIRTLADAVKELQKQAAPQMAMPRAGMRAAPPGRR